MSDPNEPSDPSEPIVPDGLTLPGDLELPDDAIGLDFGALLGAGGEDGFDFGALLEQAGQMQAQIAEAQQLAASQVVEGVAGGGVVRVIVNGAMEFQSVVISPDAVDPADVEMLQDLVLAALHDAVTRVGELQAGAMGLGDIDLGGLGGLLGGEA